MKSILDRNFRYTPAAATDIRKTFARVKKEMEKRKREDERKVTPMVKHGRG